MKGIWLSEECWVWMLRNKRTPVKESDQPSFQDQAAF